MGIRNRQSEFAKEFAEFVVWLYEQGYEVTFGEAQRTEEMAEIYLRKKNLFLQMMLKMLLK